MLTSIGVDCPGAVVLETVGTLLARAVALKTGVALGTYADDVSHFDITYGLGANARRYTDDLVPNDDGVSSISLDLELHQF